MKNPLTGKEDGRLRGKVVVKIVSEDGWAAGNHPKVIKVKCEKSLTKEQEERAIEQTIYPDGGVDWSSWERDTIDEFGFSISPSI